MGAYAQRARRLTVEKQSGGSGYGLLYSGSAEESTSITLYTGADVIAAGRFLCPITSNIRETAFVCGASVPSSAVVAARIWSDNSGAPSAILALGQAVNATSLAATPTMTRLSVFDTKLTAGVYYWAGVAINSGTGAERIQVAKGRWYAPDYGKVNQWSQTQGWHVPDLFFGLTMQLWGTRV